MPVYLKSQAQTKDKALVRVLIFDEPPTVVPVEYFNYSNKFLIKYALELPKYTGINDYAIELKKVSSHLLVQFIA